MSFEKEMNILLVWFMACVPVVYSIGVLKVKSLRASHCKHKEPVAQITYLRNKKIGDNSYFDFNVNFTENFPTQMKLTIAIQKCASEESPDTCVQFSKPTVSNFCKYVDAKNQIWTPFFNCLSPPVPCPMTKGFHYGRNCTFDFTSFNLVPIENAYFKGYIEIIGPKKKLLVCFNCDVGVARSLIP